MMFSDFRAKATPLVDEKLETIDLNQLGTLRANSAANAAYWLTPPAADKALFTKFKKEVKGYYYSHQQRKCCYCSIELSKHQGSYDAEHILDRSTHPQFMFALNNLAAACKPCNGAKSDKSALVNNAPLTAVPSLSSEYRIVHPHLDDWDAHFEYDKFSRVRPKPESSKARYTFQICKIASLNHARLSDYFDPDDSRLAEKYLREYHDADSPGKKAKYFVLLDNLATNAKFGKATAVIEVLKLEQPTGA